MASLADVQNAYLAINRAPLDATAAASVLRSIEQGQTTLAAYTADLIQKAASTTGAAVALLAFVIGQTPTSQHLDELKAAADAQFAYYQKMGVGNPGLGPFEAFGKALASDPTTGFAAKYGAMSDAAFIASAYGSIYGQGPTPAAAASLQAQLDYFVDLYTKAGFTAAQAALEAKGAVLGQVIGYAFVDPAAAALSTLDDQVAAFFNKAATGDASIYSSSLPSLEVVPPPAPPPPVFSVAKDGANAVTFANAGTTVEVSFSGGTYTFTSSGGMTGTGTVAGPIASIDVPVATKLSLDAALAMGVAFPGAGIVALTDTGALDAATLKAIEAATTGLLDASSVTAITNAAVSDAHLLFVANQGTSGDKIHTAADVAVTLTGTTATGSMLAAIDDATAGFVDASSVMSLTSATVAQAKQILVAHNGASGDTISTAPGLVVNLVDTDTVSAADLNGINAATTGLVSSSSITGIVGTAADIKTALLAVTGGTALSLIALDEITLTDAIKNTDLTGVSLANSATITLADVAGNSILLARGTIPISGAVLTVDGSALTGTNALNFQGSGLSSSVVHITGGVGNDVFRGQLGNDTLIGGGGNDAIEGNDGNDSIDGGNGNDTLKGGEGNDTITGGSGDDFINGGNGADVFTGGVGADTYDYFEPMEGGDTVTDFDSDDRVLVSELDFPGYGQVIARSGSGNYNDSYCPDGSGYLMLYTNIDTGITQLVADYNGNGGGYAYVVVTFAGHVPVRLDQIHFTDYS